MSLEYSIVLIDDVLDEKQVFKSCTRPSVQVLVVGFFKIMLEQFSLQAQLLHS